jgi:Leucine-rich repeat (LRR) protein
LNLNDNLLIELPDTIGNLNNLQYVNLSDNLLIELPDTIKNLTKLELSLTNNKLRKISSYIEKIKKIYIDYNSYNKNMIYKFKIIYISKTSEYKIIKNHIIVNLFIYKKLNY